MTDPGCDHKENCRCGKFYPTSKYVARDATPGDDQLNQEKSCRVLCRLEVDADF